MESYVGQAFLERLRAEGTPFAVLGDRSGELTLALPRRAIGGLPRRLAGFAQGFDLGLVQLEGSGYDGWRCMLSWSDEVGRPRFLRLRLHGDYYHGTRRLLAAEELLAPSPAVRFIYGVLEGVQRGGFDSTGLSELWHDAPRASLAQLRRFWRRPADLRLLAQAAKHGNWGAAQAALPRLRRRLARAVRPLLDTLVAQLAASLRRRLQPSGARIVFTGRETAARTNVLAAVARELAPLCLEMVEHHPGDARRADFRVVFDAPEGLAEHADDVVALGRGQRLQEMVALAEQGILRWLEWRVERRFPAALVGENPLAARLLQHLPFLGHFMACRILCKVRSPILMPYPFGIVIEDGAQIGRRVTVMQQAMIGRGAVIEDGVLVGPGARVLGGIRVGRGAVIAPNAVVTRDVPSHSVAGERRQNGAIVVNT